MDILQTIKNEMAAFDAKRKELVSELKDKFPAILKPLFEKYPMVEKISWHQYTPYFNDGDECTFSVCNDDIQINGEESYDTQLPKQSFTDFESILQEVDESFYKDLFGDHSEITVNSDGTIEVEEYEHD